jgi:hypothetical protein
MKGGEVAEDGKAPYSLTFRPHPTGLSAVDAQWEAGEILPLPFLRYRFCELKYRGAVGRRQVHCTLIVKIIRFYC